MKVSVIPVDLRGEKRFMVSWKPAGGKRLRRYFKFKKDAQSHAASITDVKSGQGEIWMALTGPERAVLIGVWEAAKSRGVNLWDALNAFNPEQDCTKRVQDAYTQFITEREAALPSKRTLAALKSNVGRFVKTCSHRTLSDVKRADVMTWLNGLKPRTFNTYLTSLNTFFHWCVKLQYLKASPAAAIEKISESRMDDLDEEPAILSPCQSAALLAAARAIDPGLIPYIAVCLFAGLRPQRESAKLAWADIGDGEILVRGLNAKDRQRRHVPIHPALRLWLDQGGDLPPKNLRRRFTRVRSAVGLLAAWKQDCMRHTFASCSLASFGAEKTIAALGHGDYSMLFGHYRALVSQERSRAFWSIHPALIGGRMIVT